MQVRVFYSRIGTTNNPQYTIVKSDFTWDKQNIWSFNMPDPTLKQRFTAMVSVEFYQIDQETTLFEPKAPKTSILLRRDTLYPFYLFGSEQGVSQN